jgi:hypothetical protein
MYQMLKTLISIRLGLELVWRRGSAEAGLKMLGADSEIVLVSEKLDQVEIDINVESVDSAVFPSTYKSGVVPSLKTLG